MSLTIGPVTDAMVALATAAVNGKTVGGQLFTVSDGPPVQMTLGMFIVGMEEPPLEGPVAETAGSRTRLTMGAYTSQEEYTLPCHIAVVFPAGTAKQARDLAVSVFDAWWDLMAADPSFGGVLPGGSAAAVDLRFIAELRGTEGQPARAQIISFGLHCTAVT